MPSMRNKDDVLALEMAGEERQEPSEQYVLSNDLIRIQPSSSAYGDKSPKRSNDIENTGELSERDQALKKALDFCEQHN